LLAEGETSVLTFWVKTFARTGVEVLFNGRPRAVESIRVQGGLRFQTAVEHAPVLVTIRCAEGEWLLHVLSSAELEPLREAERLRASGDFAAALDALQPVRQHPDIAVRAKVIGLLGRIAIARGEHKEAIADLEQSIRMNRALGLVSREMNDRYALSFILTNEGDRAAAREVLRGAGELAASYPTGASWAQYYEGVGCSETGDLRRALTLLGRAAIDADRLGIEDRWFSATLLQVRTLHQLARDTEARLLLEPLATRIPKAPPCARAEALELLGPLTFKLRQNAAALERAGALLADAVELYRGACPKPRRFASSLVQLGLVKLAENKTDEAAALLSASRAAHADPGVPLRLGQLELDAMIAEDRRDPSAEQKYRRLELHGLTLEDPLTRWRGLVGRGLALDRRGLADAAIAAYEEAEIVLGQVRFNAPLGGGRETFLGSRIESASRLIELLLRQGRIEDALRAARRSRARSLSALAWQSRLDAAPDDLRRSWYTAVSRYQQRRAALERDTAADWQLSADKLEHTREERARVARSARELLDEALAQLGLQTEDTLAPLAPAAGELVLLYHPIPSGWVGFAVNRDGVTARRLPAEPARSRGLDEVADSLLGPFSALLERSDQVRVLAFGTLNRIDFHALPWKGRPLISSVAVRYAVDVTRTARPPPSGSGQDRLDRHSACRIAELGSRGGDCRGPTAGGRLGRPATARRHGHAGRDHGVARHRRDQLVSIRRPRQLRRPRRLGEPARPRGQPAFDDRRHPDAPRRAGPRDPRRMRNGHERRDRRRRPGTRPGVRDCWNGVGGRVEPSGQGRRRGTHRGRPLRSTSTSPRLGHRTPASSRAA
jgi:tetratricopeptide (TPR) repeat protein